MTTFLDTNVLIRHFTGDPPALARRAGELLEWADDLVLTDVIAAECVYVLESFYEAPRPQIALLMRSTIAHRSITAPNASVILRALALYEAGHDFADSYLVACAEGESAKIASLDRGIDRIGAVERVS